MFDQRMDIDIVSGNVLGLGLSSGNISNYAGLKIYILVILDALLKE